jgi:hypothetical protein
MIISKNTMLVPYIVKCIKVLRKYLCKIIIFHKIYSKFKHIYNIYIHIYINVINMRVIHFLTLIPKSQFTCLKET